jgi:uncharacterized protein (TIGR03435 family)
MRFEVASVKPGMPGAQPNFAAQPSGRFFAVNVSLIMLVSMAHQVYNDFQIVGGPDWVRTARYDVEAKAPSGVQLGPLATEGPQSPVQQMLASLLAERFNLKVHDETRMLPGFDLKVARTDGKLGPKMTPSPPGIDCAAVRAARRAQHASPAPAVGQIAPCSMRISPGAFVAGTLPLETLASFLSQQMRRVVVDRTPLFGNYDFDLTWLPDDLDTPAGFSAGQSAAPSGATVNATGPTLVTALREQLGLELVPAMEPTNVLVIDSISPLAPN